MEMDRAGTDTTAYPAHAVGSVWCGSLRGPFPRLYGVHPIIDFLAQIMVSIGSRGANLPLPYITAVKRELVLKKPSRNLDIVSDWKNRGGGSE